MVRYCYVCNKKQTKNGNICLHKFPRNEMICLRWKEFCGLRKADDVKALFICSSHFCAEDFKWDVSVSGKNKLLNSEAIPSIISRKRQTSEKEIEIELTKKKSRIVNDNNVEPQVYINVPMEIYTEVVKLETAEVIRPQETQALTNVLINTCISSPTIELCSTPKKRKYMEPRYISELMTSDVNTPRKARRIIKFIKANDLKRRERIQNLQRMNRNLLKRIENLENMIEHLKGKLLMSEDAADVLLL